MSNHFSSPICLGPHGTAIRSTSDDGRFLLDTTFKATDLVLTSIAHDTPPTYADKVLAIHSPVQVLPCRANFKVQSGTQPAVNLAGLNTATSAQVRVKYPALYASAAIGSHGY